MTGRYTIGAVLAAALAAGSVPPAPAQSPRPARPAAAPPQIGPPKWTWAPRTEVPQSWWAWSPRFPSTRDEVWKAPDVPTRADLMGGAYLQSAPLNFGGNDTLHGAVLVPPLQSAFPLPHAILRVEARAEINGATIQESNGADFVQMDGRFHEASVRVRHGIFDRAELWAELTTAGWGLDNDLVLLDEGVLLPEDGEDISAAFLTNMNVGGKILAWAPDSGVGALSVALEAKLPVNNRSDKLATSGNADVALSLLGSWNFDPWVVHANLGYVMTGDYDFPGKTEPLDGLVFAGAGVVYPVSRWFAVAGQMQVHSSAFGFLDGADDPAVTLTAGPRFELWGRWHLEVGVGVVVTPVSADWMFGIELGRTIELGYGNLRRLAWEKP